MPIYEPREDSELLAKVVRERARGRVLDMGTGSGIQAFAALENPDVTEVVAADLDPEAVAHVEERARAAGETRLRAVHSDLFSGLRMQRFDTIVCNPPYLPDDAEQPLELALDGGPGGYELSVRFLRAARDHLAPRGQVLFLFSSLTNKERIDQAIRSLGYRAETAVELAMFFERLYVYSLRRVGDGAE